MLSVMPEICPLLALTSPSHIDSAGYFDSASQIESARSSTEEAPASA
jgi:hypothetical protein